MRIEKTPLAKSSDDNLAIKAGLLSVFSAYVAVTDCYNRENPNYLSFAVLITFSALTGLYVVLKTSIAWESRKS